MKCQMCDQNFFSTEWAKDETLFNLKYIICDKCLLYILEGRKDIEELNLRRSYTKINMLKDKIEKDDNTSKTVNPMDVVLSLFQRGFQIGVVIKVNNKQQLLEYWTKHPDLFIEDMLGIKLLYYQRVMLRLMNFNKRLRSSDVPSKYRLCKYGSEFCHMCEIEDCEVRDKL